MRSRGDQPTWQLLLDAARRLTDTGMSEFGRQDLISYVRSIDPTRERSSIDPIIQGLTENAIGGPRSACGEVFRRIGRGRYVLLELEGYPRPGRPPSEKRRAPVSRGVSAKRTRIEARLNALTDGFDGFVTAYDDAVPFVRSGQYESHRATIDPRRLHATVEAALLDDELLDRIHQTLQKWGIGKRASRLVAQSEFREALRAEAGRLVSLDGRALEALHEDAEAIGEQVCDLVLELAIVDNVARIVPGTKTLHHLLPDLVPPMDRAWTGRFFEWNPADLQMNQRRTFLTAWRDLAWVAETAQPSRFVGEGWKTSPTKVLDNAVIAYTMR
jgi:hypothetical protein